MEGAEGIIEYFCNESISTNDQIESGIVVVAEKSCICQIPFKCVRWQQFEPQFPPYFRLFYKHKHAIYAECAQSGWVWVIYWLFLFLKGETEWEIKRKLYLLQSIGWVGICAHIRLTFTAQQCTLIN